MATEDSELDDLARLLDDPSAEARLAARRKLAEAGRRALPALVRTLAEGGTEARREAAMALGDLRLAEGVPPLLAALEREPYEVASWVARALGLARDGRALAPLVARLEDESMRSAAALALAELGDPQAIAPLKAALVLLRDRFDYGAYLGRYWLVAALVRLGDRSNDTIEALKEVIDRDFGHETQQTWGSIRDTAVDLLLEAEGEEEALKFLLPFLRRERETLQVRYRIARHRFLAGDRSVLVTATMERMARHPLYPTQAAEARDLVATSN